LNGACASENGRHQVAGAEILDAALARHGQDPGTPQETLAVPPAITSMMVPAIIIPAAMMMAAVVVAMVPTISSMIMGKGGFRRNDVLEHQERSQCADRLEVSRQKRATSRRSGLDPALNGFTHYSTPLLRTIGPNANSSQNGIAPNEPCNGRYYVVLKYITYCMLL
jgi:hypothetical protein